MLPDCIIHHASVHTGHARTAHHCQHQHQPRLAVAVAPCAWAPPTAASAGNVSGRDPPLVEGRLGAPAIIARYLIHGTTGQPYLPLAVHTRTRALSARRPLPTASPGRPLPLLSRRPPPHAPGHRYRPPTRRDSRRRRRPCGVVISALYKSHTSTHLLFDLTSAVCLTSMYRWPNRRHTSLLSL